jgi:PIN domain nuclease of toxin-antitoxin system
LKLQLDTTYLLPAIGIAIKNLPNDAPVKLISKGHQIVLSEISIFELSAKGAKYVAAGALAAERVTRGIRAIIYEEAIETIPIHDSKLLETAFELRTMLDDFIDCLILSSALNHSDSLVTEDADILELKENKRFNNLLSATHPHFKIRKLAETL